MIAQSQVGYFSLFTAFIQSYTDRLLQYSYIHIYIYICNQAI